MLCSYLSAPFGAACYITQPNMCMDLKIYARKLFDCNTA